MSESFKSADVASLYRAFEAAVGRKDVEGLLANFYLPGVVFVGTGLPLTQGEGVKHEQLQTLVAETGKVLVDFSIVHVETVDGGKLQDRSTCVFQKGAEGWRCIADVFIRD
jgi:ketosteroid isomerase-like protein